MSKAKPGKTAGGEPPVPLEARRGFRDRERKQLRKEMQIGVRLRQMRQEHHLTQEQVAWKLALNRTAYTHYENGVNMPDILTLVRLADVYAIPPQEFVQFLIRPEEEGGEAPVEADALPSKIK